VLVKAHQADCGNSVPTTYMGTARDVYNEGALIFPAVKIQQNFQDNEVIIRMCELRIRVPKQWRGDYIAMLGAARIGEQELEKLGGEMGWESLRTHTSQWFDYSEQRMIRAISKMRSGRAVARGRHDPVPGSPAEGIEIQVKVTIDAAEATIDVDLRDNPGGLLNEGVAVADRFLRRGQRAPRREMRPTAKGNRRAADLKRPQR